MGIYGYPGSDSLGDTDSLLSNPKSSQIFRLQLLAQSMEIWTTAEIKSR